MANKILFISDLHFDFTNRYPSCSRSTDFGYENCRYKDGNYWTHLEQHLPQKDQVESFLRIINLQITKNDYLIIAGDSFNNYQKTINFINKIDNLHINGCYVLGNHDYWNDGSLSIQEIEIQYKKLTKNNKYFKTLFAGDVLSFKNLKIIGDCGWTNFCGDSERADTEFLLKHNLPEIKRIKNFNLENVVFQHNKWIEFATNFLNNHKNCLVVTHFPMFYIQGDDLSKWFGSNTNITSSCFWIFGHNHKNQFFGNHICNQRGYKIKEIVFNSLSNSNEIIPLSDEKQLQKYIDFPKTFDKFNWNDYRRGYKRVSSNKTNFEALIKNKVKYTQIIDGIISSYIPRNINGWCFGASAFLNDEITKNISLILNANNYLKTHEIDENITMYLTCAVITGYAYNGMSMSVSSMRPISPNDIFRWYLFYTNISINKIDKVIQVRTSTNFISNTTISFPVVNNKEIPLQYQNQICKKFELTFNDSLKRLGYNSQVMLNLKVNTNKRDTSKWINIFDKKQATMFKKKVDKLLVNHSWSEIAKILNYDSIEKKYYRICKRYKLVRYKKRRG